LDLQPDDLTAGLVGHCQPDKKASIASGIEISDMYVCFNRNKVTSSALMLSKKNRQLQCLQNRFWQTQYNLQIALNVGNSTIGTVTNVTYMMSRMKNVSFLSALLGLVAWKCAV